IGKAQTTPDASFGPVFIIVQDQFLVQSRLHLKHVKKKLKRGKKIKTFLGLVPRAPALTHPIWSSSSIALMGTYLIAHFFCPPLGPFSSSLASVGLRRPGLAFVGRRWLLSDKIRYTR